jgi:hypothetical protein
MMTFTPSVVGWYEGERIRDGERGWFPADHTVEIQNEHVRARNLREQYRLKRRSPAVVLSADYPVGLESCDSSSV